MREITPEFIAALAESMGGVVGPADEDNRGRPYIRFDSPLCRLVIRESWHHRGKWQAIIWDVSGHNVYRSESANFTPSRPIHEIARALSRRVLEPSRQPLIEHYTKIGTKAAYERELQERVEKLEAVFGLKNDITGYYHNHFVRLPQFRVSSEYCLGGKSESGFTAEVTVRSFECYLMIARLVAEDHRLHAVEKAV